MADDKKRAYYDSLVRAKVIPAEVSFESFTQNISTDKQYSDIVYSGLETASKLGIVKDIPPRKQFDSVLRVGTGTITEQPVFNPTPTESTTRQTTFPTPEELNTPIAPNQPLPNVGGIGTPQPQIEPQVTPTGLPKMDGLEQGAQVMGGVPSVDPLANAPQQQFQWSGQQPVQPVVQPVSQMPQTPEQGAVEQKNINPYEFGVTKLGEFEGAIASQIGSELKGIAETGYSLDNKIVSALEGTPFEGGYKAPYSKPEDSWLYQAGQGMQNFAEKDLYRNPEYAGGVSGMVAQGLGSVATIAMTGLNPSGGILKYGSKLMTNPQLIAYGAKQLFSAPMVRGALAMVGQETDSARQLHRMANQMDKDAYVVERMALGEDKEDAGRAWENLRIKTEDEVAESMILPGIVAGVTEAIPLERLLVRLGKPAQNIIVNAFKQGGIQGAEEATQEVIQQTIINAGIGSTYNEAQKLTTGLLESAEGGGATGFVLGSVLTALVGKRANVKQRLQAGEISQQDAITEMEDINKGEKLVQDKLQALDNRLLLTEGGSKVAGLLPESTQTKPTDKKFIPMGSGNLPSSGKTIVTPSPYEVANLPEAETFFETNEPALTNPLVTMPTEVESVFDKIADGIMVSPESLHTAYQWVNDNFKGIMQNKALSDAEKGATLNIFNGMLSDIDKANTEGQKFVEEVETGSVQDRVPAVRPEGKLPEGQKPGETQTPALDQAKQIREENRKKQAGTNVLPSSGLTIVPPSPTSEAVTTETEVVPEAIPSSPQVQAEVTTETPNTTEQVTETILTPKQNESETTIQEEPLLEGVRDGGAENQTGQESTQLRTQETGKEEVGTTETVGQEAGQLIPETTTEVVLTEPNATDVETIGKIEKATEKGRELALAKPVNKWVKRAFETFEDLSARAQKAGIYDGKKLNIGGKEYTLDTPAKFKAFLSASQENFDAINEAVGVDVKQEPNVSKKEKTKAEREAKMAELNAKEEEINKQILKGLGDLSMNLNPQQVSLLAQKAWVKVQRVLLQTQLSTTAIADAIKRAVDSAIVEINNQLVANGQQPLDPDNDDITNIINGVRMLAYPSTPPGQIGTPPVQQPGVQIGANVYTKNQEELAKRKFKKFREGKKNADPKSEPFFRAVRRKIAEIRQKLYSPKALLNMVEAEIGRIPHYSYTKTRTLPIGRAMEQLRGKARSLAIPYMERFKEIIDPIKDNIEDFEQYLILKRIIDRNIVDKLNQAVPDSKANRRTTGGFTETDADILLNSMRNRLGSEFDKFETAGDELQKLYDDNLKDLVKAGVLSQKRYNDIKAQNKFYVPFDVVQRDFRGNIVTDMESDKTLSPNVIKAIQGIETPKTASKLDQVIGVYYKMMDAGDIDVDSYYYLATERITDARDSGVITQEQFEVLMDALADPALELGSPLNKTLKIIQSSQYQVARQGYMNDIDRMVESDKDEIYFHRLKPGEEIPESEAIITYYKNGKAQRVSVSKDLKDAIYGATRAELGAFQTAMAYASTPFKLLATGLSPVFMPVNFTIDIARALTSKAGLGSGKTALEKAIEPIQIPILYTEALMESIVGNLINTEFGKAIGLKKITPEFMYNQYQEWSKSPSYSEGTYFGTMFEEAFKVDSKQDIKDQQFIEKWTKRINSILSNPELSKSIADGLMQEKKINRDALQGMLDVLKITGKILENTHKVYGNIKLSGTELGARRGLDKYMGGYIDKLTQSKSASTPQQIEDSFDVVQDEILNNIGSPNFEQIPPNIRNASLWLPFLGAAIKGNMTDLTRVSGQTGTKNAGSDAMAFALRNGALFAVPAFASALYLGLKDDDDEEKKLYGQIDEATKNRNQIYMVSRQDSTGRTYTDAIMIPIRGLPEAFNAVGRASGQALAETIKNELTPEELGKITEDMIITGVSSQMVGNLADKTFLTDVDPETGKRTETRKESEPLNRLMSMVSGTNPLIKFGMEEIANKNFFTKHDLTPENRKANALKLAILNEEIDERTGKPISPSLLRTKFTSEWAIEASKELEKNGIRATPILLDHISDAFLAGSPKTWEMGVINKIKGRFSWMEKQQSYENMNKKREAYEKKENEK